MQSKVNKGEALAIGRVDLYGCADESEALARGETRIRTLPQRLSDDVLAALDEATGTPVRTANFEVLPMLASPCDMYAMGVLSARILLVDEENTLAIAVDQLLSLGRQVATKSFEESPFGLRLRSVVKEDPRWGLALGPHRLTARPEMRAMASGVLPTELWWDMVGIILRLFPGTARNQ